jgi:hypothetical protein
LLSLRNFNAGDKSRTFQNHIKRVTPFSFIFLIFLKKKQMEKRDKAIRYFRELDLHTKVCEKCICDSIDIIRQIQ